MNRIDIPLTLSEQITMLKSIIHIMFCLCLVLTIAFGCSLYHLYRYKAMYDKEWTENAAYVMTLDQCRSIKWGKK
jgi:hypothetical protein